VVQVFVTSGTFDGNLGGLVGADTVCTTAAEEATPSLPGTWTAWLSDPNGNAVARIIDGEYQLLNGTIVANNRVDLTDGSLAAAINLDENLDTVSAEVDVWTATDVDGTWGDSGTCFNWTSNDALDFAQIGRANQADAFWTDAEGGGPCNFLNRLYCFAD
jgi:hypothetical protein